METASTELRRFDVETTENSTWRTHRYFVDFESRFYVEISNSNRCHNFHGDLPFKIDAISTNFPRGISTLIDGKSTKMCPLGISFLKLFSFEYFQRFCQIHPVKSFCIICLMNTWHVDFWLLYLNVCTIQTSVVTWFYIILNLSQGNWGFLKLRFLTV